MRTINTAYEVSWRERPRPSRGGKAVATASLAVALTLAGLMFVPALLGYERYVITSGSMTGAFGTGSVVYEQKVPVSELEVGDVITYTPPTASSGDEMITHRIVAAADDAQSTRVFRTQGDANAAPDPWTFTLDGETQARVEFHVPYVGYALSALSVREVRMGVIGIPALLIAVAILWGLVSDIRKATRGSEAAPVTARVRGDDAR